MQVTLLALGKLKPGPEQALIDEYRKRCGWKLTIKELAVRKPLEGDALKNAEGELILAELPPGAVLIALDERGEAIASAAFSQSLQRYEEAANDVYFCIGGADGLSDAVRKRAQKRWCFGALTWPHMLVRVMLAEQLYRAWSIKQGHPYHRA